MSRISTARDLTHYLTSYPDEITFGEEAPEVVLDRYYAPGCVIANDASSWIASDSSIMSVRRASERRAFASR